MTDITRALDHARDLVGQAIDAIHSAPEKATIVDLINACERVDTRYREFCDNYDEENGDPAGSSYVDGISIEFYIEAMDWHDISEALRTLRKEKPCPYCDGIEEHTPTCNGT